MLQNVLNVPSRVGTTFISSAAVRYTAAGLIGIAVMKLVDFAIKKYQDSNPLNQFPPAIRAALSKASYGRWTDKEAPNFAEMDEKKLSLAIGRYKGLPALMVKIHEIANNITNLKVVPFIFVDGKCNCEHPQFKKTFSTNENSPRESVQMGTGGIDNLYLEISHGNEEDRQMTQKLVSLIKGQDITDGEVTLKLARQQVLKA